MDVEIDTSGPRTVSPLGKFLVLASLGRGGMAEVFLALARGPNGFSKLVVLKLLRPHLADDDEFLDMFLAEARLAACLNHANVVQTYEVGVEGGRHAIVMEYLEGRTLAQIHRQAKEELPLALELRVLADVLAGLHHAHELVDHEGARLDIVHRDVSPQNVFVTYDGQVKLLDFGIAKAANGGSRTKTGVFKGKLRYTAPERLGGVDADRRSDVFSVGVMLWQRLTGRRMWAGMNDLGIMRSLATGAPIARPRDVNPRVPEVLDAICTKALARAPTDRYATAAELQDALEDHLEAESSAGTHRALARFMSDGFSELRAEFQRVVEEQTRLAMGVGTEALPESSSRVRVDAVPLLGGSPASSDSLSLSIVERTSDTPPPRESAPVEVAPPVARARPPPEARARKAVGLLLVVAASGALFFLAGRITLRAPEIAPASPEPAVLVAPSTFPSTSIREPPPVETAPPIRRPPALMQTAPTHSIPSSPRVKPPLPDTAPPRGAPATIRAEPARREPDCTSPYFVDDDGLKKIRTECL